MPDAAGHVCSSYAASNRLIDCAKRAKYSDDQISGHAKGQGLVDVMVGEKDDSLADMVAMDA